MHFHVPLHWHPLQSLHGIWDQHPFWRIGLSALAYGLVVALMAMAAVLISTDMPFFEVPAAH